MAITYPYDSKETVKTVSTPVPVANPGNYVQVTTPDASAAVYINVESNNQIPEILSFKTSVLKKVSRNPLMTYLFPSKAKGGYQFVIKHEGIQRNTDAAGVSTDEPFVVYTVCRGTKGLVADGAFWLNQMNRLAGFYGTLNAGGTAYEAVQKKLDRLTRGIANQGEII